MTIVAVAGGLGDFGRLIVDALSETGKHKVFVITRRPIQYPSRSSPLGNEPYNPMIYTDYSDEDALAEQLAERKVETVICTFIMDSDDVCEAELRLIRALDKSPSPLIKRFIPSEFNVEYDVPDHILPYPEKKYHMRAREELAKTKTLQYTYIYTGMFMDYFGMPRVESSLRPLAFIVDPQHRVALIPGPGLARMSMTFSTDAARYIAYALELNEWPRIMYTAVSTVKVQDLVAMVEISSGHKITFQTVKNQDTYDLIKGDADVLPFNVKIANQYRDRFPGGIRQLRTLVGTLEAGIAFGAYNLTKAPDDWLNLTEVFKGKGPKPRKILDLLKEAWGGEDQDEDQDEE